MVRCSFHQVEKFNPEKQRLLVRRFHVQRLSPAAHTRTWIPQPAADLPLWFLITKKPPFRVTAEAYIRARTRVRSFFLEYFGGGVVRLQL